MTREPTFLGSQFSGRQGTSTTGGYDKRSEPVGKTAVRGVWQRETQRRQLVHCAARTFRKGPGSADWAAARRARTRTGAGVRRRLCPREGRAFYFAKSRSQAKVIVPTSFAAEVG